MNLEEKTENMPTAAGEDSSPNKKVNNTSGAKGEKTAVEKLKKKPQDKKREVKIETEEEKIKGAERQKEIAGEAEALGRLDLYRWQILAYPLAKRLAIRDLEAMPHGAIRDLCTINKLTYHTVIGLINETITFEAPKLLLDLLYVLEYEVKLTIETTPTVKGTRQYKEEYYYTLRKKGTT